MAIQKLNKQMRKFADHASAIRVGKTKDSHKRLQINSISLSEWDKMTTFVKRKNATHKENNSNFRHTVLSSQQNNSRLEWYFYKQFYKNISSMLISNQKAKQEIRSPDSLFIVSFIIRSGFLSSRIHQIDLHGA